MRRFFKVLFTTAAVIVAAGYMIPETLQLEADVLA